MLKKVMYITGTRADYGLMQETLKLLDEDENIHLNIVATGMHLMQEFGYSLNEIKKDNFNLHVINQTYKKDNEQSMSEFIGNLIVDLTVLMCELKPDIVLLLGDRGEMLAGAVAASYLQIPVAHIHGGDVSSTVDDSARHAITKLSNIHFPATEKSASRIKQMGENPDNIFVVGAPGLSLRARRADRRRKAIGDQRLSPWYGYRRTTPAVRLAPERHLCRAPRIAGRGYGDPESQAVRFRQALSGLLGTRPRLDARSQSRRQRRDPAPGDADEHRWGSRPAVPLLAPGSGCALQVSYARRRCGGGGAEKRSEESGCISG